MVRESAGANGENLWANQSLTSTHLGATKTFTFPSNLPSSSTAGKRVLVATPGFAALGVVTPDYTIPNGFLATDGGTVNFASVDPCGLHRASRRRRARDRSRRCVDPERRDQFRRAGRVDGPGVGCAHRNPGPPAGNDGTLSFTFTSATSATVTLPGRVTAIQPQAF